MLADVRCLRDRGVRLPRGKVLATPPLRGTLTVFKRQDTWRDCMVPMAMLLGPDLINYLLPPLDEVRVLRWSGQNLILSGQVEISLRSGPLLERQAWWVQLVTEPAPAMH